MMLIEIVAANAIALVLYLKAMQLDAMSNGNEFTTILPNFKVYCTRLSHSHTPSQVITDVIGVKCEPRDAKLLTEFFTHLAAETNSSHRDGTFVPKGASSLLGPQTYKQVLKDNNRFLSNVATIPINLEYKAWFAVLIRMPPMILQHSLFMITSSVNHGFYELSLLVIKNVFLSPLAPTCRQLMLGSMRTLNPWFANRSQKASICPLLFSLAILINPRILLPANPMLTS